MATDISGPIFIPDNENKIHVNTNLTQSYWNMKMLQHDHHWWKVTKYITQVLYYIWDALLDYLHFMLLSKYTLLHFGGKSCTSTQLHLFWPMTCCIRDKIMDSEINIFYWQPADLQIIKKMFNIESENQSIHCLLYVKVHVNIFILLVLLIY